MCVFVLMSKRASADRPLFATGSDDEVEMAKKLSTEALLGQAMRRGVAASADELQVKKVDIDELKMAHTKFQQLVEGVPVWEGEAIVHLRADGSVSTITDDLKGSVAVDVHPTLNPKMALRRAVNSLDSNGNISDEPKIQLYIYRAQDGDHLVYRVEIPRVDGNDVPSVPVIFIDAHTGEIVDTYDNLQTGTGSSLYSGTISISTS